MWDWSREIWNRGWIPSAPAGPKSAPEGREELQSTPAGRDGQSGEGDRDLGEAEAGWAGCSGSGKATVAVAAQWQSTAAVQGDGGKTSQSGRNEGGSERCK